MHLTYTKFPSWNFRSNPNILYNHNIKNNHTMEQRQATLFNFKTFRSPDRIDENKRTSSNNAETEPPTTREE